MKDVPAALLFLLTGVLAAAPQVAASPRPPREGGLLLPNLVAQPPIRVVDPQYSEEPLFGCTEYEVVVEGAERCLRFDTVVTNFGRGPLELRYDAGATEAGGQVVQRIYRKGGGHADVPGGAYEFHPTHAHFHYGRFFVARLWSMDVDGNRAGDEPVAVSSKAGYCFYDAEDYAPGDGDETPAYSADACRTPVVDGARATIVTGLSRGWMDFYDYRLDGQYVDVGTVRDGTYLLEIVVDPDDLIRESNEDDNTIVVPARVGVDQGRR